MEKDLVSIIVPVYNVEQYLEKSLDSIIKQTYKNLEIILINDGSTDKSLSILKKYEKKDKRVKVINKKNGGVSSARNKGLDICCGKYITFVDADDYVAVDYIETLYKKIKEYDVDIVFSNAIDVQENGKKRYCKKNNKDILLNSEGIFKEILKEEIITCVCWGNLYKADLIKSICFDIKMHIAEDFKFLIEVIKCSNKSLVIPEKKYYYVVRNTSATKQGFNEKWYDEINYCKDLMIKYKNTKFEKYTIKRYVRVVASCIYIFKIDKVVKMKLKSLIKPYFFRYIFSDIVSFKLKIMYFIVLLK